uniref:hypothetical protein n=1 Tax=Butyricimonas virosa TaxID=544645 RepID=UPI0040293765
LKTLTTTNRAKLQIKLVIGYLSIIGWNIFSKQKLANIIGKNHKCPVPFNKFTMTVFTSTNNSGYKITMYKILKIKHGK